jgi:hypothetical protein
LFAAFSVAVVLGKTRNLLLSPKQSQKNRYGCLV